MHLLTGRPISPSHFSTQNVGFLRSTSRDSETLDQMRLGIHEDSSESNLQRPTDVTKGHHHPARAFDLGIGMEPEK